MSKKKSVLTDEHKIIIDKCCQLLSVDQLCIALNLSKELINNYYEMANKKAALKFDQRHGSVSMTQAQSMIDDTIKYEQANIYDSPKYKDCIHRTE